MYFLLEKFKSSPVILPEEIILENPRDVLVFQAERGLCLFFKQSEGSTGADDSNFGPKQGGGDSEKKFSKLPNKKSKQTLAGLKGSEF